MPTLGSTRHESFSFTYTPMASMWVVTLHYLLCTRTYPYPVTLLPIGSGYFQAKSFPISIPQHFSNLVILHLHTHEDGTDSVLKRWHTKFRRPGITQKKAYKDQTCLFTQVETATYIRPLYIS